MALKYVQSNTLYLAGSGVIVGATTIILTTLTDIYGNVLTMTDFGSIGYITLEPDTTNEEAATFTGVTANTNGTYTLTGVKTALAKSPYTETSGLVRSHAGGTKVVITDNVAFWATFGNKQNDEALVGRWTTPVAPLNANDLVNKTYADGLAIAGAPNASTTVKGIGTVTVAPASATAPIFVGANDPQFVNYFADTGAADAYVITPSSAVAAYVVGQRFSFKATNTNTTTSTLNVSGLGVKTIKKLDGATNLNAGDIISGQMVLVEYDGTNFQMLNPVANLATLTLLGDGSDGDVVISGNTSLTRDMFYNNLTINNGIVLSPKGFRIFVKGTLNCIGTGKIQSNGGNGGAGGIGATSAPAAGTAGAADYSNATLPGPKAGVAGGVGNNTSGNNGVNGVAVTLNISGVAAVAGGDSGRGSNSATVGTGGTAGSTGSAVKTPPRTYVNANNLYDLINSTITRHEITPSGGSGGGGGGDGGGSPHYGGSGGGSGSTGGFISIFANSITNLNVESIGGNGGNGGDGTLSGSGGGGGGAGGNGGYVLIFYKSKTTVTSTVTGGTAGAGGAAGTGGVATAGSAGTAGNAGVTLQIQF